MAHHATHTTPYRPFPQGHNSATAGATPGTIGIPAMKSGARAELRDLAESADSPMVLPLDTEHGPSFEVESAASLPVFRLPRATVGRLDSHASLLSQTESEASLAGSASTHSLPGSFSSFTSELSPGRDLQHSASSVATAPSSPQSPISRAASLLRLNSYHRTSSGEGPEDPVVVVVAWNIVFTSVRARKALDCPEVASAMNALYTALDCESPKVGEVDTCFDALHRAIAGRLCLDADQQLLQALSQLKGAIATMPDELEAIYRSSLRS